MTVGLIAPSSHLFEPDNYRQAFEVVESLGLKPQWMPHAKEQRGYLAGSDEGRAADFMQAFSDPMIDIVWCVRGGYGAMRILPLIDLEVVRKNPKPFLGYSDVTALHLAIQKSVGLVTFHAPMPSSTLPPYAVGEWQKVTGRAEPAGAIGQSPAFEPTPGRANKEHRRTTLHGGKRQGRLTGGNLTLITRLLSTPYEIDTKDKILFLEDVGEATYRIDGMLMQLKLAGKLKQCAGIAFGKFTDDVPQGSATMPRLATESVLRELTAGLDVPVFSGLLCGHVGEQTTVPYGVLAEIDADLTTLTLLESAVTPS